MLKLLILLVLLWVIRRQCPMGAGAADILLAAEYGVAAWLATCVIAWAVGEARKRLP